MKALEMIAPGTALREGIESILHAKTGGLIVIGEPEDLSFLNSGGIKLEIEYTPAFLYQVAKMDGAIILNVNATKITMANVQLMPDPTILSHETGTRHRTAERVSKQTDALVIAISQRREVVSVYVDGTKYILEDIPVVLAKANQALATLDKFRTRLDQVSTRLTALEFEGGVTLHDVLTMLQRSELVTRMAVEIERYIVELGSWRRPWSAPRPRRRRSCATISRATPTRPMRPRSRRSEGFRTRTCSTLAGWPSCSATTAS
jgi:diadenylate cyclase